MANFSHLSGLQVDRETTARYPFDNIVVNGRSPTLIVRPATQDNKPYQREMFRRNEGMARRLNARRGMSDKQVLEAGEKLRAIWREIFPQTVVVGWEDVLDADGTDLPFSEENCREFLAALPNWMADDFFAFCTRPDSFVDSVVLDVSAVEETAKN